MSYSFSIRAATKAAAIAAAAVKLDEVVAQQPVHKVDRDQALAAVEAFVNILPDDEARDVSLSVHGSVGWMGSTDGEHSICNASVGVSAGLAPKEV